MPDDPARNGRNGWTKGPIPWLLAGGVGLGGTGAVVTGFEVNSAKIASNEAWLTRLQAQADATNATLSKNEHDLSTRIDALRHDFNAQLEHMVPMTLSRDRIERFQTDMDQLERLLGARQDRMQEEINAVRDRIGSRRGPDER